MTPKYANYDATAIDAISVINWLVDAMTYGCMSYVKNSGPRTIPPAIPVAPQRIAAIIQKIANLIMSPMDLNI
jgi:hypothetical protein